MHAVIVTLFSHKDFNVFKNVFVYSRDVKIMFFLWLRVSFVPLRNDPAPVKEALPLK